MVIIVEKKTFALGFVAAFIAITIYIYLNNASLTSIIMQGGAQGIFWYFITNLSYVLIFISLLLLNREAGVLKNIAGSILLISAFDILSFPRMSAIGLSQDMSMLASSDGILITKFMGMGYSYSMVYPFYYLILPILLVLLALWILGIHNFFKTIMGRGN